MRRSVLWGMIAILGMPVIATAEEQRPSPPAGNNATEPPNPAPGAIFGRGDVLLWTVPEIAAPTTEAKDSKYWIGLSCGPLDGTLRSQLGLEAGSGLAIQQIADNSPAREAGLAVHDLITEVKIGDEAHKPTDISQLASLVQQAETKPMTFSVLRRGQPLKITVTPTERNVANRVLGRIMLSDDPSWFRVVGPVVSSRLGLSDSKALPDDLTVVITKTGSQPVQITVRQKDRGEWNLKEKEPALQPEHVSQAVVDVLAYLSRLEGHMSVRQGQPTFRFEPGAQVSFGIAASGAPARDATDARAGTSSGSPAAIPVRKPPTLFSVQQRLDEIQKQQEQVTKTLDELRQALQDWQQKQQKK